MLRRWLDTLIIIWEYDWIPRDSGQIKIFHQPKIPFPYFSPPVWGENLGFRSLFFDQSILESGWISRQLRLTTPLQCNGAPAVWSGCLRDPEMVAWLCCWNSVWNRNKQQTTATTTTTTTTTTTSSTQQSSKQQATKQQKHKSNQQQPPQQTNLTLSL